MADNLVFIHRHQHLGRDVERRAIVAQCGGHAHQMRDLLAAALRHLHDQEPAHSLAAAARHVHRLRPRRGWIDVERNRFERGQIAQPPIAERMVHQGRLQHVARVRTEIDRMEVPLNSQRPTAVGLPDHLEGAGSPVGVEARDLNGLVHPGDQPGIGAVKGEEERGCPLSGILQRDLVGDAPSGCAVRIRMGAGQRERLSVDVEFGHVDMCRAVRRDECADVPPVLRVRPG